jgi:hypothetical protein
MTPIARNPRASSRSIAAIAAATGLIVLASPAWPTCPGGSMGGGGQSSGGGASSGSSSGGGSTQPSGMSGSSGEGERHGGGDSWSNGAAEGARQGAADTLNNDLNGGDGGGGRRSGGGGDGSKVLGGPIKALADAQAADASARCAELHARLDALHTIPDLAADAAYGQAYYDQTMQKTPQQIDKEIAVRQTRADHLSDPSQQFNDPQLDFLLRLKAARSIGIGEQDAKNAFLRKIGAENSAAAQVNAQIHSTEAEIASLGCDTAGGASPRADASPSPDASTSDPAQGGGSAQ